MPTDTSHDDDKPLRAIAGELLPLLPENYDKALRVIAHLRDLVEWRRKGKFPVKNTPHLTVVPSVGDTK